MFTVYAEKEIFENIVVFNDETPNWYKIFCNHSDVCLNLTDAELVLEQVPGTPIFEYILANGGRSPIALKEYFDMIYADYSLMSEKPRSAFFLNCSKEEVKSLESDYGIIVQSLESLNDKVLVTSFFEEFQKGDKIQKGTLNGWQSLLDFYVPPSNAMVMTDDYLLTTIQNNGKTTIHAGIENIKWILDKLLPKDLKIDYHITILSEDKDRNEAWRNDLVNLLKKEVGVLRKYNIRLEIVFIKSEHLHKRRLILNYVNASCEHGLCMFNPYDSLTINMANDIRFNQIFCTLNSEHSGKTEFDSMSKALKLVKTLCSDLTKHLNNKTSVYRGAILGDCNPDFSIKNRLINDV